MQTVTRTLIDLSQKGTKIIVPKTITNVEKFFSGNDGVAVSASLTFRARVLPDLPKKIQSDEAFLDYFLPNRQISDPVIMRELGNPEHASIHTVLSRMIALVKKQRNFEAGVLAFKGSSANVFFTKEGFVLNLFRKSPEDSTETYSWMFGCYEISNDKNHKFKTETRWQVFSESIKE